MTILQCFDATCPGGGSTLGEQKRVTLDVPKELLERCTIMAQQLGESRSTIIRLAIRFGLETLPGAVASRKTLNLRSTSSGLEDDLFLPDISPKKG